MKRSRILLLGLLLIFTLCGFGPLEEIQNLTPSRAFLLHLKAGDSYTICIPDYLQHDLPGLDQELAASINLWGYYIGRNVPIRFVTAHSLPGGAQESFEAVINRHHKACGKDVDLAVAYANFEESDYIHSETDLLYYWSPVKGTVQKKPDHIRRGLLLRRPKKDDGFQWQSFSKGQNPAPSAEQILEMLKKRNLQFYHPEFRKHASSLRIMLHETGHMWGLCDMYNTDDKEGTNCDPTFTETDKSGTIFFANDTIMSLSGALQTHYLTDNDIAGIQALAKRSTVQPPLSEAQLKAIFVQPIEHRAIELLKIKSLESIGGHQIQLQYALFTNTPYHISVELFRGDHSETVDLGNYLNAVQNQNESLSIPDRNLADYDRIRLTVAEMPEGAAYKAMPAPGAVFLEDGMAVQAK
ncbi:hypothetical protein WDW37_00635 [Bdellovibrionota bacterium FG-1]